MISKLTPAGVRSLIERHGKEDPLIDYKRDYKLGKSTEKAGIELVKDVCAMANSARRRDGIIIFGVDTDGSIPGIPSATLATFDDNNAQQLLKACIEPPPEVQIYPVDIDGKTVLVCHIGESAQLHAISINCEFDKRAAEEKAKATGEPMERCRSCPASVGNGPRA